MKAFNINIFCPFLFFCVVLSVSADCGNKPAQPAALAEGTLDNTQLRELDQAMSVYFTKVDSHVDCLSDIANGLDFEAEDYEQESAEISRQTESAEDSRLIAIELFNKLVTSVGTD